MSLPRTRDLLLLSFLYFPLNLFWTALSSELLQVRVDELAGAAHRALILGLIHIGGATVATLVTLVVGALSDNTSHPMGRRYIWVFCGMVLGAAASLGFSLSSTVWQLLLAFLLVRTGLHMAVAAYEAVIPDRIPRYQQGLAAGFGEFWDVLGLMAGLSLVALLGRGVISYQLDTPLSPVMEARLGVFLICLLAAGLFFLCLLMNLRWVCEPPTEKYLPQPWPRVLQRALLWDASKAPAFTRLFLGNSILGVGIFTGFNYLRYFLMEGPRAGDMDERVMVVGIIFALGGIMGALAAGNLADRVSKRLLLIIFCLLGALSAVGFCLAVAPVMIRLMAFGFGVSYSATTAVVWSQATTSSPVGKEGRFMAFFACSLTMPQLVTGILGGTIGQAYGFHTLFWTIPFFMVAGLLVLCTVPENPDKRLSIS